MMGRKLVAVLVLALLVMVPAVSAQGPYLQINNGQINVTSGEQPQVVVQFGNRSQHTIYNVTVLCRFPNADNLGVITRANLGPFSANFVEPPYRTFDYEVGWGLNDTFFEIAGITIPPGQNYNVNYKIKITAPRGTHSEIECRMFSGTGRIDFGMTVGLDTIPVIVR